MTPEEASIALRVEVPWLENSHNYQALAELEDNKARFILGCLIILKDVTQGGLSNFVYSFFGNVTIADQDNFNLLIQHSDMSHELYLVLNAMHKAALGETLVSSDSFNALIREISSESGRETFRDKSAIIELLSKSGDIYTKPSVKAVISTTLNTSFRAVLTQIFNEGISGYQSILTNDIIQSLLGFREFRAEQTETTSSGSYTRVRTEESIRIRAIAMVLKHLADNNSWMTARAHMQTLITMARGMDNRLNSASLSPRELQDIVITRLRSVQGAEPILAILAPDLARPERLRLLSPARIPKYPAGNERQRTLIELGIAAEDARINHLIDVGTLEAITVPCRLAGDITPYYFEKSTIMSLSRAVIAHDIEVTFSPAITALLGEIGAQDEPFQMPLTFGHPLTRVRYFDADIIDCEQEYNAKFDSVVADIRTKKM